MIIVDDFLCGGFYFRCDINIKIIVDIKVECYVNALFTAACLCLIEWEEVGRGRKHEIIKRKSKYTHINLLIFNDISPR